MKKSEDKIQSECTIWAHNTYPDFRLNWWHVPNGGTRNIIEARKLKTMGVKSGVWDIHCYYNGQFSIIEMKTETGVLSAEQKIWGQQMKKMGANLYVCRSLEEFKLIFMHIFTPLPI